jgi:hypothetical protein
MGVSGGVPLGDNWPRGEAGSASGGQGAAAHSAVERRNSRTIPGFLSRRAATGHGQSIQHSSIEPSSPAKIASTLLLGRFLKLSEKNRICGTILDRSVEPRNLCVKREYTQLVGAGARLWISTAMTGRNYLSLGLAVANAFSCDCRSAIFCCAAPISSCFAST